MIFLHIQKFGIRAVGVSNLLGLYNRIQTEIISLDALGVTHDKSGVISAHLVLSRLPDDLRLESNGPVMEKVGDLDYY